jgi:tRNA-specific 2-thiouridylase
MLRRMAGLARSRDTRVLVAMSGGVDSSVAAARLVERGWDVVGATLHLWDYPDDASERTRCCAPEDAHDARRVADALGIPHYTFDRRALFARAVVEPFVDGYLDGRTPSPCVWCNRSVKIRELFALADRLGAHAVATGHYARVGRDTAGRWRLQRGRDRRKDQSYFLHTLGERELARLVLPLGEATKREVRAEAIARGLPGADKGESQELCFVPAGRYASFVEERADGRVRPGAIVGADGRRLGAHAGVHRFTIGQRRGLGVALGRPAFVVHLDAASAKVVLGEEAELFARGARLGDDARLCDDASLPLDAVVQVRAGHEGAPATITRGANGAMLVRFASPVRAVAPGQFAVAYDGDRVLGGGTIVATLPAERAAVPAAGVA